VSSHPWHWIMFKKLFQTSILHEFFLARLYNHFKNWFSILKSVKSVSATWEASAELISANAFGKWISWHQFCWSYLVLAWVEIHLGYFRLWFFVFFPGNHWLWWLDLNNRERFICYFSRLRFEVQLKSGDKLFS